MVMFELMVIMLGPLQLYLTMGINRSANERHGHDTDETSVNLLLFIRGGTRVRLDKREAKGFSESIGDRNRFRSHGTTAGTVMAVGFLVTAGVLNLGDSRREMGDRRIMVGIGHSVSETHARGHLRNYDADRTGIDMLSC
jgi:hypothetical protein